jgi:hypothetical protein
MFSCTSFRLPGILLVVLVGTLAAGSAAALKTRNVILITLDGLRWQELFTGAEEALIDEEHGGISDANEIRRLFWRDTAQARREALMPFLWRVIASQGQLFGNVDRGSVVKATNGLNFSYPGYNELLAGSPDPRIDSNDKRPNPNVTVLEWLNGKPAFKGRVAAFCAWDVFAYILNRKRNGMYVRAGWEPMATGDLDARQELLNQLIRETTPLWDGVTYDSFLIVGALDHLRAKKPRVLYVAFGETDDWAHEGRYDGVLRSAHGADRYIQRLWETAQAMPEYRDRTTLLITTDHGRGSGPRGWKDHGQRVVGSEYIWIAALGPDTAPLGERSDTRPLRQGQIAATIAALLEEDLAAASPGAARPVDDVIGR